MSHLLALNLNAIAQLSAERIMDSLLLGLILTGFAAVLLRAVGRLNSGTRFAVWFSVLTRRLVLLVKSSLAPASTAPATPAVSCVMAT